MSASADIGPGGLADSVRTRLFVALQYLLPQHFLSRVVRAITRLRTPLVREPLIRAFDDRFHPDMSDAELSDPLSYASFNAYLEGRWEMSRRASTTPLGQPCSLNRPPANGALEESFHGLRLIRARK